MKIFLEDDEKKIFELIKSHAVKLSCIPRVAGGWVRDKLLGIKSNDIDITIDNISGEKFAKSFADNSNLSFGVIKSNPDKSKHLETVVLQIYNKSIDFISLRTEDYSDSRIPIIKDGSVEEDAFRRDITINSLFYNLLTEEVEDYTTKGIEDLKNKIIRTPLHPLKTFKDDPLRILRVIRFSVKYNFKIDNEIVDTLKNKSFKKYLIDKVSNERIRIELDKILNINYTEGIKYMVEYHLIEPIFKYKINIDLRVLDYTEYELNLYKNEFRDIFCLKLYSILIFSSFLYKNSYNIDICRESLRYPKEIINKIQQIEKNFTLFSNDDNLSINSFYKSKKYTELLHCEINILDKIKNKVNDIIGCKNKLLRFLRQMKAEWLITLLIIKIFLKLNNVDEKIIDKLINEIKQNGFEEIYLFKIKISQDKIERLNIHKKFIKIFIEEGSIFKILNKNKTDEEVFEYLLNERNKFINE